MGVKATPTEGFICFFDWETCKLVQRIDESPKNVYWNDSGELLIVACDGVFYVIKYNSAAAESFLDSNPDGTVGCDDAFELIASVNEDVASGLFVGDVFVFSTVSNRLNYWVGGLVDTVHHLDRPLHIIGYMAAQNRLYLIDKSNNIVTFKLLMAVME